jgi:beta-galactosidase
LDPVGALPALPKIGLTMAVPAGFEQFSWLGRGPLESYPDRKQAMDVGLYKGKVDDQWTDYVRPQENGNKEEVRWATLTNRSGMGLLFVAQGPLAMTVSHYTAKDVDDWRHENGEPRKRQVPVKRAETIVCLDAQQMGLGGASCGPAPLEQYLCRPRPMDFRVILRPIATREDARLKGRERLPVMPPPSITRGEDAMLTVTPAVHGGALEVFVNGRAISYAGPFQLDEAAEVRAISKAAGMISSPATTARFEKIVPVQKLDRSGWKVLSVDSFEPGEGEPANVLDGDKGTFWHTNYSNGETKHPHEIVIDLGKGQTFVGLELLPRQGQSNGRIGRYQVFVSNSATRWGGPVLEGQMPNTTERQRLMFPSTITGRYVRLVALSEVGGNTWTSLAEFDVLKAVGK